MKLKIMEVNVLGTKYNVFVDTQDHDERLKINDGYIMCERKTIVLDRNNKDVHQVHVLKHELVHAFLYESGLDVETWANNEEIVDWIALQLMKVSNTTKLAIKKLKPYYTKPKVVIENETNKAEERQKSTANS